MTEDETIAPAEGNNPPKQEQPAPQPASSPAAAPVVPGTPASPPPAPNPTPVPADPMKSSIAKILEGVKLPERRDFKGIADIPTTPLSGPEPAILEEHIVKT